MRITSLNTFNRDIDNLNLVDIVLVEMRNRLILIYISPPSLPHLGGGGGYFS